MPKSIAGDPGSPYPGRGILDLSWVVLDNGGNPVYTGRHLIGPGELDGHNYGAINLLDKLCDTTNNCNIHPNISLIGGIRVTIRAVNSTDVTFASPNSQDTQNNIDLETVSNISITPQDVNGDATDLPSTFSLNSTGKYNGSQSLKNASVLWQLPSSRVFNFVLFSEGNITPQ
ncbi:MAG: hypothetical protein HY092_01550 [Candidatus Kerfeldbacteria bacterium]|nr:hypothetical protein [Candidatus Kerfeldbacteria bacterium]